MLEGGGEPKTIDMIDQVSQPVSQPVSRSVDSLVDVDGVYS